MTARIVVIGSLNMDLVVRAQRHPHPGETLTGTGFSTVPGGKGANQAVAAARMGAQVTMIGCVGADAFGQQMLDALSADDVDVARVERAGDTTGIALITVSDSGENTIIVVPGANGAVSPSRVLANEDCISGADVLLLQLEVPVPTVRASVELAARHGVPVILNPAPAQPLDRDLVRHVSYLVPNEHEATLLLGPGASKTAQQPESAALLLRNLGAKNVIVTLGEHGALLASEEGVTRVPAFPVEPVDSTAAGDAFLGVFAVAMSEGKTPEEAVTWGCAAGALACTVLGAQPSLPTRERVLDLLASRRSGA